MKKTKKILKITALVFAILWVLIKIVSTFLYDYREISGSSMSGLTNGKRYFVCKFCKDYKRGDVVFYYDTDYRLAYIGRIIGLPKERIEVEKDLVTINGDKLKEDYADWSEWKSDVKKTIKLNDQEYFVLYDKRKMNQGEEESLNSNKIIYYYLDGKFLQ